MTDAPERIWALAYETEDDPDAVAIGYAKGFFGAHEYIRADLAKPKVKPLEFSDPSKTDNQYCEVPIGVGFSAYYEIDQLDFDLAQVSFGVHCHEFEAEVIWRGPKAEAVEQANKHNQRRILEALE